MIGLRRRVADDQRGQAVIALVVVLFLVGAPLLVLAIEVGSWMRADRQIQAAADAAALAGAQELPVSGGSGGPAEDQANGYLEENGCTLDTGCRPAKGAAQTVTFPAANTIRVAASQDVPVLFSKLIGRDSLPVTGRAEAEALAPRTVSSSELMAESDGETYVIPLAVAAGATCTTSSCFASKKFLSFGDDELGLVCPPSGHCNSGQVHHQFRCACLNLGIGSNDAFGGHLNGAIRNALEGVEGKTLIVPVFTSRSGGSYSVSGFAAFKVTDVDWTDKEVDGYFTKYMLRGRLSEGTPGVPNYGVRVIGLTS